MLDAIPFYFSAKFKHIHLMDDDALKRFVFMGSFLHHKNLYPNPQTHTHR